MGEPFPPLVALTLVLVFTAAIAGVVLGATHLISAAL